MSINVNDKNIGHATAYAYYKAGGGTMTEAEFTEFMADFGTASQTAVEAAQAALASENAAQTAATTATNKASEATTAAQTAITKAAEASTSASTATSAKDTAVSASQTATTKATEATTAAATATGAATTATTAKDDAVSAKTAAQTAQTGAETAAASVSASAAQIATNTSDINELKEDLSEIITDVESANLFNKNTATAESETLYISDYIPIENGKTYTWYSTYNRNFVVYDSNKGNEWILYGNNNNGIHTVTVDRTGAAFARFKLTSGNLDSAMLVEGDTYPSSYIPYVQYKQIKNGVKLPDYFYASNPLYGKKIAVNGDSIMVGAGYAGGFAKMIADENLMSFVNNAESGGCITSGNNTSGGNPAHCICDTVSSMPDDADYILFDGGINDMWHDIPLGTYTDDMSVVGTTTTFYGALDKLFQTALGKWSSGQKIVFVITHKVGNTWRVKRSISGLSFADYREAIIKMCLKYSIPYCDIYGISQFNTELQYYYDTYTTNDGTHPNQLGYEYFYKTQVQNFLKTL